MRPTPDVEKPGFNIEFDFRTDISEAQLEGLELARKRWTSVIVKDHAAAVCIPAGTFFSCGFGLARTMCVDDLLIGVGIQEMDGPGQVAGGGGPCAADRLGNVRVGVIVFDQADAELLIEMGSWEQAITHEIGHVLGLGTMWEYYQRLIPPASDSPPYYYMGENGNAALNTLLNTQDEKIIIEDKGGRGTARAHWKENVYGSEVMTGHLQGDGAFMPLSLLSIRALEDLGYVVDVTKADPYEVPKQDSSSNRRLRAGQKQDKPRVQLKYDVLGADIDTLDESTLVVKPGREQDLEDDKAKFEVRRRRLSSSATN